MPFYLRTGKRMQARVAEIVIHFRDVPHAIFPRPLGLSPQNRLVIRLQPEESIRLYFLVKQPGDTVTLTQTSLDLDLANSFARRAGAYERLLLDVIRGRLGLFVRRDEQVQVRRWVEPITETGATARCRQALRPALGTGLVVGAAVARRRAVARRGVAGAAGVPRPGAQRCAAARRQTGRREDRTKGGIIDAVLRTCIGGRPGGSLAISVGNALELVIGVKGWAVLAVSGGRSPVAMFERLRHRHVRWESVTVTLVDERAVPPAIPTATARWCASTCCARMPGAPISSRWWPTRRMPPIPPPPWPA